MSSSTKAKNNAAEEPKGPGLDEIFAALEERTDALTKRLKELAGESARLKVALVETAAERDRLKAELTTAREIEARQTEATEALSRYESERDAIRDRIARLIASLEGVEAPAEES